MKNLLFTTLILTQVSLFSQHIIPKNIDFSNCRDGEDVEYCKTHKLMNKFKKDPEFLREFMEEKMNLKR